MKKYIYILLCSFQIVVSSVGLISSHYKIPRLWGDVINIPKEDPIGHFEDQSDDVLSDSEDMTDAQSAYFNREEDPVFYDSEDMTDEQFDFLNQQHEEDPIFYDAEDTSENLSLGQFLGKMQNLHNIIENLENPNDRITLASNEYNALREKYPQYQKYWTEHRQQLAAIARTEKLAQLAQKEAQILALQDVNQNNKQEKTSSWFDKFKFWKSK